MFNKFLWLMVLFVIFGMYIPFSEAAPCKIDNIDEMDFSIQDDEQKNEIIKLIKTQFGKPDDESLYDGNVDISKIDINNDGKDEYIVFGSEGTANILSIGIFSLDGKEVPDSFWGTSQVAKENFLVEGQSYPFLTPWFTNACGKNYFGYKRQDGSKQLYLIDKKVILACTKDWMEFYKSRDIKEQWSSFCGIHLTQIDPNKSRKNIIGQYMVSHTIKYPDDNVSDYLDPGEAEILVCPYQDKNLSLTITLGGFWSSSKYPDILKYTAVATYDPLHGYLIQQPLNDEEGSPEFSGRFQKAYLVPETDRLVLEVLDDGPLNNNSWKYSQRQKTDLCPKQ